MREDSAFQIRNDMISLSAFLIFVIATVIPVIFYYVVHHFLEKESNAIQDQARNRGS